MYDTLMDTLMEETLMKEACLVCECGRRSLKYCPMSTGTPSPTKFRSQEAKTAKVMLPRTLGSAPLCVRRLSLGGVATHLMSFCG